MKRSPHKVVLIGFGAMGAHHFRILKSTPNVELVAVVDPHLHPGPGLADLQWEAGWIAWIASPASTHADLVAKMLHKGLHVFVEKPLCLSGEQAAELARIAESGNLLLFVGHSERYHPEFLRLLDEVQGEGVQRISCRRNGPEPKSPRDCGVAMDLAVHDLDCIHALIGHQSPTRISVTSKVMDHTQSWENELSALIEYSNGVSVDLQVSRVRSHKERRMTVWTKTRQIEADFSISFKTERDEPLRLEHREFFRILEEKNWLFAKKRLASAALAVQTAERLAAGL